MAAILVYYNHPDMLDFIICCPGKYEQLYHRHNKDDPKDGGIAEYLPEFFLKQKLKCSHASLILNFRILNASRNMVIPARINVSFQMNANPTPLIITDFTIW